jgi:hypothetical protein
MKRKLETDYSIQTIARKLTANSARTSIDPARPWFNPGQYCGTNLQNTTNSGTNTCSQPNYPALWSYRYGLAPIRNWFISNIVYPGKSDDKYIYPADPDSADIDTFQNNQCGGEALGFTVYESGIFGVNYEPYWISLISFFIALYFFRDRSKPTIPILGDQYPAVALALNAFIASYVGGYMRDNFWYPFVSSWLQLFGIDPADKRQVALQGPFLNTYFSFILSEITQNSKSSVDAGALVMISTLIKEQLIDRIGTWTYDSVYGNQTIIGPDNVSAGVDVNGVSCKAVVDPPIQPLTAPPCTDIYGIQRCWYGRGTGHWNQYNCETSDDHGAQENGCERWGLFWYPKCDPGFDNSACCICSCDPYYGNNFEWFTGLFPQCR